MHLPKRSYRALALVGAIGLTASFLQMIPQSASAADPITTPQPFSATAAQTTFIAQAVQCAGAASGTTGCEQLFTAVSGASSTNGAVAATPVNLGAPYPSNYNAIAYRTSDRFIYAIQTSNNHILQIGQGDLSDTDPSNDIIIKDLGLPAFATTADGTAWSGSGANGSGKANINAGTFGQDANANKMYLRLGNGRGSDTIWTLDFSGCTAGFDSATCVTAASGKLSAVLPNSADMVYTDGYLWSVSAKQTPAGNDAGGDANWRGIWRIDPSTFQARVFAAPLDTSGTSTTALSAAGATPPNGLVVTTGGYGAQWVYGNGNLGVSNNETGWIYQLAINDPTGSPTFSVISVVPGPSSSGNDGTAIPGLPIDLGIQVNVAQQYVPGQPVQFQLVVTNNGTNQPGVDPAAQVVSSWTATADIADLLTSLGITTDDVTGLSSNCTLTGTVLTCEGGQLALNGTGTGSFTVPTRVNTADKPAPVLEVTASVTGSSSDFNSTNDTGVGRSYPELITLAKTTEATTFDLGQSLTYTLTATNTGTVSQQTLAHVTLIDNLDGAVVAQTCTVTSAGATSQQANGSIVLGPGDQAACSVSYTVKQADVDAGTLVNTAKVQAWGQTQETTATPVEATADKTITGAGTAGIEVTKTASPMTVTELDQPITYNISVKNTGTVSLSNIVVTDPMFGTGTICTIAGPVASQATASCPSAFTYTPKPADFVAGSISNMATATGQPPTGLNLTPPTDTDTVTVTAVPRTGIDLVKTATPDVVTSIGQSVHYAFSVTNTGNVPLTNVVVTDPMFGGTTTPICQIASLAPGQTDTTCGATYITQRSDFVAGSIVNMATATGVPPSGTGLVPPNDSSTVTVQAPSAGSISLTKTATPRIINSVGQRVTYVLVATNNGTSTLTDVQISDPMLNSSAPVCTFASLAPGQSTDPDACTIQYTVTQDAFNNGLVTNAATVTAQSPGGEVNASASQTVTTNRRASIKLIKTPDVMSYDHVGQVITYRFEVTNQGNVPLSNVVVTDPLIPNLNCNLGTLAAGVDPECFGTYTVTQQDLDRGYIINNAKVTGTPPGDMPDVTASGGSTVSADQKVAIDLVKSASAQTVSAVGDPIRYTFSVTNTGNVTLSNVTVKDPMFGNAAVCTIATLAPQATDTTSCAFTYYATQTDLDNGRVTNTATATGTPPPNSVLRPPTDDNTVIVNTTQNPAIDLTKTTSTPIIRTLGGVAQYNLLVVNTGNVTLFNVSIADALPGVQLSGCTWASLAPNARVSCTGTYAITQADLDNGQVLNSATVSGTSKVGTTVRDTDSAIVTTPGTPDIQLTKTVDQPQLANPGTVNYTFAIKNIGNVTLHGLTLADADLPGIDLTACNATLASTATLAPNATVTCQAPYVVSQAKFDAGVFTNTARATGIGPDNTTQVTSDSSATVTPQQRPQIQLTKTVALPTNATVTGADQQVTYQFVIQNVGNVTLSNVYVRDTDLGTNAQLCLVDASPNDTLAPGASRTCSVNYATTQANIDAGTFVNTATTYGTAPDKVTVVNDEDDATITATQNPQIALSKTADKTTVSMPGEAIAYTFSITNPGNVTLHDITLTDTKLPASALADCANTLAGQTLAPGAAPLVCTARYTTTEADFIAGTIANTATVTGTAPNGTDKPTDDDSVTVTALQNPDITLTKLPDRTVITTAGTVVTYTLMVENTGNLPLTNVEISDSKLGSGVLCTIPSLGVGETDDTCQLPYTALQSDIDLGVINNTASVRATPPANLPVVEDTDTATVTVTQTPGILLTKTSDKSTVAQAGDVVTYLFAARNTGNVTLTNVTITDALLADAGAAPATSVSKITGCTVGTTSYTNGAILLAPGQTVNCQATYTVKQSDIDNGTLTNSAVATGTPPNNLQPPTSSSNITVTNTRNAAILLTKTPTPGHVSAVGDQVSYAFVAKNTGNVTLTDVIITDSMLGGQICNVGTLVPGQSSLASQCTKIYTVVQSDLNASTIVNTAYATATPPAGMTPPNAPAQAIVIVDRRASIVLTKTPSIPTVTYVGQPINYLFTVYNNGTVPLTNVTVYDPLLSDTSVCVIPSLGVGQTDTTSCSGTYIAQQTDINRGSIANSSRAVGTPPAGLPDAVASAAATVGVQRTTSIEVVKQANPATVTTANTPVTYTFVVTNTGNVTLYNVVVTDPMFPNLNCTIGQLAPNTPNNSCTAVYTVTQSDINAGSVVNTASVTGNPPPNSSLNPPTDGDTVTVLTPRTPGITLDKTADASTINTVGQTVTYTFDVRNSGNVTLNNVRVSDPMFGAGSICTLGTLNPGGSATCQKTYVVTRADLNAGSLANTATATGTPPAGLRSPTDTDDVTIPATQNPSIQLAKSVAPTTVANAGDRVTYGFLVTNNGNVTISNIVVNDTKLGGNICTIASLDAGQSRACPSIQYTMTQNDINAGLIPNTATVTGTGPAPTNTPVSAQDSKLVTATQNPNIAIVKTANPTTVTAAGQQVTYSFLVRNTGNVTLNNVTVTDPLLGSGWSCPVGTLAPNQADATCTATYTVTQPNIDAGVINNTATATGTSPQNTTVTGTSNATVTATQTPRISLTKTADPTEIQSVGAVVTYTFVVKNIGNTTLSNVTLRDPMFPSLTCPTTTLSATGVTDGSDQMTCTATLTATLATLTGGPFTNTATVTGVSPKNVTVSATDSATVTPTLHPGISVVKTADTSRALKVGDPITYSFLVTNTGNMPLTNVVVKDPKLANAAGDPICVIGDLPVGGQDNTCTATYTTTLADYNNGSTTNTVNVEGTYQPGQPPTTGTYTVTPPLPQQPNIKLTKTVDKMANLHVNDLLTYTFVVENTGNVTLSNVTITDPMFSGSVCSSPIGSLDPGAKATCTKTYTVTQADIDNGSIYNNATATGTPPNPQLTPPTSSSNVTTKGDQSAAIELTKTPSVPAGTFAGLGQTITYTLTAKNIGTTTLNGVTITDTDLPGLVLSSTCTSTAALAPQATYSCTATYVVQQGDVNNGKIDNVANVVGNAVAGLDNPQASASASVLTNPEPKISLTKTADPTTPATKAGDVVKYNFTVTNTGNVPLAPVTVTDSKLGFTCTISTLAVGATDSTSCFANYTVTQADVDAGVINNTANVIGYTTVGQNPTDSANATVTIIRTPNIELTKSASPTSVTTLGQTVQYAFVAHNTGNVTLTNVAVTDPMLGGQVCVIGTLLPGAYSGDTACVSVPYTPTQPQWDAGAWTNTATVTGTPPAGVTPSTVSAEDTATVTAVPNPLIQVTKVPSSTTYSAVGQSVTYTFTVTNIGNVSLHAISLVDTSTDVPNLGMSNCVSVFDGVNLAPNASMQCTATFTVTQAQYDKGTIANRVDVYGTSPVTATNLTGTTVTDDDEVTIAATGRQATLNLVKSATTTNPNNEVTNDGDVVTYQFVITNTGNVSLTGITLTDNFLSTGALTDCANALSGLTLYPAGQGQSSVTCSATYAATQADINAGQIVNVATANGVPPSGVTAPPPAHSTVTVKATPNPSIDLVKTADPMIVSAANTTVTYTFTVTNTGNVPLTGVVVTDPLIGGATPVCTLGDLAVGDVKYCQSSLVVTQAMLDNASLKQITNVATVTGTTPGGEMPPTVTDNASVGISLSRDASIVIIKSGDPSVVSAAGQTVTYTFTVINIGNVTDTNLRITDDKLSPNPVCTIPELDPGQQFVCPTVPYTVTTDDMAAGQIVNNATVIGDSSAGVGSVQAQTTNVVNVQVPGAYAAIRLVKSADILTQTQNYVTAAGQVITYSFNVTNRGNVPMRDIVVTDSMLGGTVCTIPSLAVGASAPTCYKQYTVTAADMANSTGEIANTAVATGYGIGTVGSTFSTSQVFIGIGHPIANPTTTLAQLTSAFVAPTDSTTSTNGQAPLVEAGPQADATQSTTTQATTTQVAAPQSTTTQADPAATQASLVSATGPSAITATTGGTVLSDKFAAVPWTAGICGFAVLLWVGFRKLRHVSDPAS